MSNKRYERLVDTMPAGLSRAVLRVLSFHTGRKNAIGRADLVKALLKAGFAVHERQARETIRALRREGHLVCSMPGENGGYYLAEDLQEYREFKNKELLSKILDMEETVRAMDQAAQTQFGNATQGSLL